MEDKDITLEDVEIALSIINVFLSKVQRVNLTMQKLKMLNANNSKIVNPNAMTFQDILNLAFALEQKKKENMQVNEQSLNENTVIPNEDIVRMKELIDKFKNKNKEL